MLPGQILVCRKETFRHARWADGGEERNNAFVRDLPRNHCAARRARSRQANTPATRPTKPKYHPKQQVVANLSGSCGAVAAARPPRCQCAFTNWKQYGADNHRREADPNQYRDSGEPHAKPRLNRDQQTRRHTGLLAPELLVQILRSSAVTQKRLSRNRRRETAAPGVKNKSTGSIPAFPP
jgi:hypothetical protein